jgi:hypothetical protein
LDQHPKFLPFPLVNSLFRQLQRVFRQPPSAFTLLTLVQQAAEKLCLPAAEKDSEARRLHSRQSRIENRGSMIAIFYPPSSILNYFYEAFSAAC